MHAVTRWPGNCMLGYYPGDIRIDVHAKTYTGILTEALFIRAKYWKPPRCFWQAKGLTACDTNISWRTTQHSNRKDRATDISKTWMNLQRIRPNEKKTTPTGKMPYDSTHIFEIRKKMKTRLVVARVKDGGEVSGGTECGYKRAAQGSLWGWSCFASWLVMHTQTCMC